MSNEETKKSLTGSAVQDGEVENVSCAAEGRAGAAEAELALLEGGADGGGGEGEGEGEDVGEDHFWVVRVA